MIKISDLTSLICTTLAANSTLTAYATASLGGTLAIQHGFNGQKPSSIASLPLIIVIPGQLADGQQVGEFVYTVHFRLYIDKDTLTTTGIIVAQDAIALMDNFVDKTYQAIKDVTSNIPPVSREYELNTWEDLPINSADMTMTWRATHLFGAEMTLS